MSKTGELTLRALLTGLVLGALLTPANVYSGLKIGWSFNMSIIALLIGFGVWRALARVRGVSAWTPQESNISQTTASAAASIISGGLVAPLPAYTLLTGEALPLGPLVAWVFAVSFLGVWMGWYLRGPLIVRAGLRFPAGAATLETLEDVFREGREAGRRLQILFTSVGIAALVKGIDTVIWSLPRGAPTAALERLTFGVEPSLLLFGFGGIIGLRVGLSLLLGAVIAWGGIAPWLLASGAVAATPEGGSLFGPLVEWLLWPGVSLMVTATLAQLVLRLRRGLERGRRKAGSAGMAGPSGPGWTGALGLAGASLLVVSLQILLFDIPLAMALVAVPLALVLAAVAAWVVGETAIPPIGAIGKVSQLGIGSLAPGQATTNLMAANTAGGAAGQAADCLNDLKVGYAVGAHPPAQILAQSAGVLIGSLVGSLVYLVLIPDPQGQLLTPEWPAPAVATWKAVAEALASGWTSIPVSARIGVALGGFGGLGLALLEARLAARRRAWIPSGAALGLAFVIPASIAVTMSLGALTAWLIAWRSPRHAERFVLPSAAGLVAGESLAGVLAAFGRMVF